MGELVAMGIVDVMVIIVVGVRTLFAAVALSEALTSGTARPKTKRRWLQVFAMFCYALMSCLSLMS